MMPVSVRCGAASAAPPPFPEPPSAWASIDSGPNAIAVKIKAALAKGCRRNQDSVLPVCIEDLRAPTCVAVHSKPEHGTRTGRGNEARDTLEASATMG